MKFGIQLYGILNNRHSDIMETLREIYSLGFRQIEVCLSLEPISGMEHTIWPLEWFQTHAWEIHNLGLEVVSAHIFAQNLAVSSAQLKRLAADYGIKQFVVKTPQEMTNENLQQAALNFMQVADALEEVGAELLLHNEVIDITERVSNRTIYEHMLALCMGKVGAQVDVGWVYAAGEDPEELLWRIAPLVKSLHYKDLRYDGAKLVPTVIGSGDIDTVACFQFARAMGIPQIIDQDEFTGNPMKEVNACLDVLKGLAQVRERTVSYLNTLDVETGEVRTLCRFDRVIEAPNWLKGQECIVFNSEGHIYAFDLKTGTETLIDTGICDNCNNDHVISPDERFIAVSHSTKEEFWMSRVYVVPIEGGTPRQVTPSAPSYLHGWSPDGADFSYCAFREHDGQMEVDIYTISVEGGEEVRLTHGGFNDGPEYSPDGRYIWFNSTRTGLMQIWRMNCDGSEQMQMTFNERNNWFAHVSPDGSKVAYLSYRKGDLEANEHLPNMQVELWIMDSDGSNPRRMISIFGGQGSINVNSWAGDSRHLAFISYELIHK